MFMNQTMLEDLTNYQNDHFGSFSLFSFLFIGIAMPGAHFTNDFSIVIKIRWKIVYVAIYFLSITSLWCFAHARTAQLLCHVKNIVTITLLEFKWEQN